MKTKAPKTKSPGAKAKTPDKKAPASSSRASSSRAKNSRSAKESAQKKNKGGKGGKGGKADKQAAAKHAQSNKRASKNPATTSDHGDIAHGDIALATLDVEIARVRKREEQKLINCAYKAGLFDMRISAQAILDVMNTTIDDLKPARSTLATLIEKRKFRQQRSRHEKRSDEARIKAILGGFMVAQCRHQPGLLDQYRPLIDAHIANHPVEKTAARNAAFMQPWLDMIEGTIPNADNKTKSDWVTPPPEDMDRIKKQSPRDRARRLIILGAWLLDYHTKSPELTQLINDQLANFLKADKIPQRIKTIVWNTIHAKTDHPAK